MSTVSPIPAATTPSSVRKVIVASLIGVSVYAVAMLLVTIICVLLAPETSKIDPAKQPTRSR